MRASQISETGVRVDISRRRPSKKVHSAPCFPCFRRSALLICWSRCLGSRS